MEVSQALARSQIATALKGGAYAQKCALERIEKSEEAEARRIAELNSACRSYQEAKWAEIAEAKKQGKPVPEPVPHPDDMVIEEDKEPKFNGPTNEEEAELVRQRCKLRDILLMQNALDLREHLKESNEDLLDGPGSGLVFALVLNDCLPERLKIDDTEILMQMMKYDCTTKRVLLTQISKGWRKCGIKARRGLTFPPVRFACNRLSFFADFAKAAKRGEFDLKAISRGQFDSKARSLLEDRQHMLSQADARKV